jgi:SAM-dependent methyltransferase
LGFVNSYEDARRAEAYAKLGFAGTYFLAYRDLPELIARHVRGREALDFGCGTGRSTRFLRDLGFSVVGVDIADDMIGKAREADPEGDYRRIPGGHFSGIGKASRDLVLSAFTFDNIPTMERKVGIFQGMGELLKREGRILLVVSSPQIYVNEWVSFSTRDFPGNREARTGDTVRIIVTDIEDRRPVEDILWTDESYHEVFERAGLVVEEVRRPLARGDEPEKWVSETRIPPWVITVLKRGEAITPGPTPRPLDD